MAGTFCKEHIAMDKRFKSCPFGALVPDDGTYEEFSSHTVQTSNEELPMGLDIVFRTLRRMARDPLFYPEQKLPDDDISIFHFNRIHEDDGSAAYDFKRVTLMRPPSQGGVKYAYIVLEVISRPEDVKSGPLEVFRLAGISVPLPVLTPENDWCNSEWAWSEWYPA